MATSDKIQVDPVTGQTTTGHEWDGIRELNTPLPRWWLWTFYACILFSIGYWVVYPAWPGITGFTHGLWGQSSRGDVAADVAAIQAQRAVTEAGLKDATVDQIAADKKLLSLALAHGKAAFAESCAPCHGAGGQGGKGYRNLTNEDWLWGGKLDDIQQTVTHGIRDYADKDTRQSAMPAFGAMGILKPEQIQQVVGYVRTLSKLEPEAGVDVAAGKQIFADNCAVCHGPQGKGNRALGAPNLTDKIWLYGSDTKTIVDGIWNGHGGVMPAWGAKLDDVTIKALAVYVHTFGGGEK